MRSTILCLLVLAASAAIADPVITSVTPNEGLVSGGTHVVIKGTGFTNVCIICSPPVPADPHVFFLSTPAASVHFVDSTTIEAVTPAHLPGLVSVVVSQVDGSPAATLHDAFTFTGDPLDAFEPILFPIFMPPVHGAFGSEFQTTARVWDQGSTAISLYGLDTSCYLFDPPIYPQIPFPLSPSSEQVLLTGCSTSTGRLFYVTKAEAKSLAAGLRVTDVTRQADSHGVEIPVVRGDEFNEERVSLLGVPIDPRFRNTLRIYALKPGPGFVNVTVGEKGYQLPLTQGADVFEPWFAVFTDFPTSGQSPIRVVVDTPRGPGGVVIPGMKIWAFVTVTNNETQQITTITPN